jgi:hypothetical protein
MAVARNASGSDLKEEDDVTIEERFLRSGRNDMLQNFVG